jgi:hypothetical protein
MNAIESAYKEVLNDMLVEKKDEVKESKTPDFKTWIAKNFSITGKDKNDTEELDAIKVLMKAKGYKDILSVLDKYHVSPEEIDKIKNGWIEMSL